MQLVSRYLATNHSVVVSDGFAGKTEYRKVYQRNIKIAKGIDNVITFEIKNSDHKPLSILNTYTPYVEVFTETMYYLNVIQVQSKKLVHLVIKDSLQSILQTLIHLILMVNI